MRATPTALVVCLLLMAALAGPAASREQGDSLTEVNKQLTNPVSETWSISFQQNNYRISTVPGQGDRWNSNLNFQPVLPMTQTGDWNLITRPVVTLINSTPYPSVEGRIERTTTFGDTILMENLAPGPAIAGNWMAVHPDDFGQKWNVQVSISPVIPKPIKGTLFWGGKGNTRHGDTTTKARQGHLLGGSRFGGCRGGTGHWRS